MEPMIILFFKGIRWHLKNPIVAATMAIVAKKAK
jgi:hypothetical protein